MTLQEIFALCLAMSDYGIGPKVLSYSDNTIMFEKIEMFFPDENTDLLNPIISNLAAERGLTVRDLVKTPHTTAVEILHKTIGYAHGDLHGGNIGFKIVDGELRVLIIDMDTAYPIVLGKYMVGVRQWMKDYFAWDGTYEEFVDYDYSNIDAYLDF
jgi:hypothetical protein